MSQIAYPPASIKYFSWYQLTYPHSSHPLSPIRVHAFIISSPPPIQKGFVAFRFQGWTCNVSILPLFCPQYRDGSLGAISPKQIPPSSVISSCIPDFYSRLVDLTTNQKGFYSVPICVPWDEAYFASHFVPERAGGRTSPRTSLRTIMVNMGKSVKLLILIRSTFLLGCWYRISNC